MDEDIDNLNAPEDISNRVHGNLVDHQTRCVHYQSRLDVIAIKFRCCDKYYACHTCHQEKAGHPAKVWPISEQNRAAVLCGICGFEMTIKAYLESSDQCPSCHAGFNPGCKNHYPLYFEL